MYIDAPRLEAFHDAIVQPEGEAQKTTVYFSERSFERLTASAGMGAGAEVDPGSFLESFSSFLPSATMEISGDVEAEGEAEHTEEQRVSMTLAPIRTPQRQLTHLTLFYLAQHPERLEFIGPDRLDDESWKTRDTIREVPRQLVFLDLPAFDEAVNGIPNTRLIPTAAEFNDGAIVPLYTEFGTDDNPSPDYPSRIEHSEGDSSETIEEKRTKYWKWFQENSSPTEAMRIVEKAATEHGHIQWIDYRVPLNSEGKTLHLHVTPSGRYDTGTFAYNFIKRGYKHGVRLVGTLKSEPDMNVLAIYEK